MKLGPCLSAALIALSLPLSVPAQQPPTQPRPVTVDDLFQIREVLDPQLSPDAQSVAYTIKTLLLKEDKPEERIWAVPTAGGYAVPMTAEGVSSSHPRWSPDGKYLAFLSARNEGKTQVWLLNRSGGEAQRLTDTPQDVDDFVWSPDSTRLVVILRDPSEEELAAAKTKDKEDAREKDKKPKTKKPWVIDRLQFKTDEVGYLDRRRAHLYVLDLATKALTRITSGDYDDARPAWSPDGRLIAFASNRSKPDPDRTYNTDIWVVAVNNTDKGAQLTQVTANPGDDDTPSWSPDGKFITYITQLDPHLFQYATHHVAVSPANGGAARVLTQSFDRNATEPRFSPDGNSIYFIADDDGTQILARVPVTGGEVTRPIAGRFMLYAYSLAKNGDIAAQIDMPDRPSEIYAQPASSNKLTRLTKTNDASLSQLKLVQPEYVHLKSKDGTTIAGYLYKPLDYTPGRKYPAILRPHGGPVWAYYAEFTLLAQLLAANGYAVLYPNPRGSTGYGENFAKAIWADWGNKDYQDDMAMVDYAIAQGIADPDKLGVGGWSYGGISTDFIIAQTTRFKAAISGAGEALNTSLYGHDQYQRDYETELGRPWENHALWDKLSPFYKVANITTPTLFMGGGIDWNVPILGSEQMYQAMKSLGRETQLVVYPGEYHEFKAPSHLKDRLERYLAWYAHYIKGDPIPATPQM
ncbi:MAG TPA: S9 family peptidase [Candidatus Acidoferrum sp.]|nr:S9 family peptidase [Candidatus Acidoferrum sp.]